ncbi:hypothetical protein [Acaryochloris sp. IP29b_bin.137]|uniref:hypothetical protein n=1 Tax=Acaryochloris sp. IP29b_bin.137 TaxID=2969217 RepID=UPI00261EEF61|nr:hypothetical protein [Acaryochloris sp. IP29b_bin.137]
MDNQEFQVVKDLVQPDNRGRISLGMTASGKNYRVLMNEAGQILLDPVVPVPEQELWLWNNPDAIATVRQGMQDVAQGEIHKLGSFAQYADLEVED